MKKHILHCLISVGLLATACAENTQAPRPEDVASALRRSADWQLENPSGISIHDWIIAPLYDGLVRTALTINEPKYLAQALRLGTQAGWAPGPRAYHADDHAVGHAWLDIYLLDRSHPERLAPVKAGEDYVLEHPVAEDLSFTKTPVTPGVVKTDRWTWCDALYMAPPTLARLHAATGDQRYLDFLDQEFRFTYDQLWDPDEHLFYRDTRYIGQRTPNGKKVFWSRGNGWVFAGIALMLERLPANHPQREFYETVFREMASAIVAAQQEDGLWRPSLLDPEEIPAGETSGSAFYTFGLAWGLNQGLLNQADHRAAALRGWKGLGTTIGADGHVGFVQPVGAAPDKFAPDSVADYGTGAFLLAGCEIYKLLGGTVVDDPASVLAAAEAILAESPPIAFTRLVPERNDDLAWENDKVAFRIYGPALRESVEDSGIDVWCKRVPSLVIDKWYRLDLAGEQSYHQDHGEGYDCYKVGDTLGCGGLGLWRDGKLVTSDVYVSAEIAWTKPDVAKFRVVYKYPSAWGPPIWEHREVTLRAGEHLFEVESTFSQADKAWGWRNRNQRLPNLPIAIGLATQSSEAQFTFASRRGVMMLWDKLGDERLGTGIVVAPDAVLTMRQQPHQGALEGVEHALAIVETDDQGRLRYRAGFAWSKAGEITTPEAWLSLLESSAGPATRD